MEARPDTSPTMTSSTKSSSFSPTLTMRGPFRPWLMVCIPALSLFLNCYTCDSSVKSSLFYTTNTVIKDAKTNFTTTINIVTQ